MSPGASSLERSHSEHPSTGSPPTGTSQPVTRALTLALQEGQPVQLRIAGSSMSPCLRPGDLVTVEPTGSKALAVGTIAAILRDGRWMMIHRIVARRPDGYLTRGDLVSRNDGFVAREEIVGYLTEAFRGPQKLALGFGYQGLPIALLSRWGLLYPLLSLVHRLGRGIRRQSI